MRDELSTDMQMVAEALGKETAYNLMARFGGCRLYVSRPDRQTIRWFHSRLGGSVKRTAVELGVSEDVVGRAVRDEHDDPSQLTIFDEINRMEKTSNTQ